MATRTVGTAEVRPGERSSGLLDLARAPDGPVSTAVHIVAGASPGPTLWVQGLIHGQEVGGAIAIGRFFGALDPAALRGTVIALPVANPLALRAWSRNLPVDGANLNRVFPGRADGGHSEQHAATLLETALAHADAIVDLHSGGERSHVPFYALYWDDDSAASRESARLARAAATPDLWATDDAWLDGAMFTHAVRRGTPALIVECGGGAAVPEAHLANYLAALEGVARALGLLPGEAPVQERYRVMGRSELLHNRAGGLFVASCTAGSVLAEGEEVGRVIDVMGEVHEVIRAPFGPAYIASIRRSYHALHSGEMVCEALRVREGGR